VRDTTFYELIHFSFSSGSLAPTFSFPTEIRNVFDLVRDGNNFKGPYHEIVKALRRHICRDRLHANVTNNLISSVKKERKRLIYHVRNSRDNLPFLKLVRH
jgi:hypothetical protein